jgi:branched-chain amino acid transport system substrate-binding protein
VKVIVDDTQGDCGKAVADVHSLVQNDHILALVGTQDSACETNYASYLKSAGVADISANPLTPLYNTNPVFFPAATTVDTYLWTFPDAAKQAGGKSFAWMTCVESAGCQIGTPIAQASAKSLGLPFFTRSFATSSPTYAAQCVAAEQFGSKYGAQSEQAVFVATANPRFADQCAQQGFKPLYVQNLQGDWNTYLKLIATDPNFNGAAGPMANFPWFFSNSATADYHSAMSQYMGGFVYGPLSAMTWMSGLVFAAGAKDLGSTPTAAGLMKGLYTIHNQSLGGGLTPVLNYVQGQPKSVPCYFSARIEDGKGSAPYTNLVAPQGLTTICKPAS